MWNKNQNLRLTVSVLCAWLWTTKVISDPLYNAVSGSKASLPCNIAVPLTVDTVSSILWYRGNSGIPIYTLVSDGDPVLSGRHFRHSVVDELGTRAYFDALADPPVLELNPVREEDEDDYRCRVDYRSPRPNTENRNMTLKVIVPPGELIIMDVNGQRLQGVIGPFDEGTHLTLICQTQRVRPLPSLTWWRGSTLIDESYAITQQGIIRNQVTLTRLKRRDLMSVYTCQASNNNMTIPVSTSVTLDINLRTTSQEVSCDLK